MYYRKYFYFTQYSQYMKIKVLVHLCDPASQRCLLLKNVIMSENVQVKVE